MLPEFNEAYLMGIFAQYAFQPMYVYGFVVCFMLAASFGLPIPEELVLISAGLVAHTARTTTPPTPGAHGVDTLTLCIVAFLAVLGSDSLVYSIGKVFGAKIIKTKFFQKQVAGNGWDRINSWFAKYGGWACGIFRFTCGFRFPGHLSCGLLGIPVWKFLAIDGIAALLSVPTQIYFVSEYGDVILKKLAEFKLYLLYAAGVALVVWGIRKIYLKNVRKNA